MAETAVHEVGSAAAPHGSGAGKLYLYVLLAIAAGALFGHFDPAHAVALKPLGDGFIALVKMLIGPIVFCTVVLGIAGAGDMRKVGRVGKREWGPAGCQVIALTEYYRAAQAGHAELLAARGFSKAEIGTHAGLADTALALAVDPALVRRDLLAQAAKGGEAQGVYGDPRRATAELGQIGVDHIVETSLAALRKQLGRP